MRGVSIFHGDSLAGRAIALALLSFLPSAAQAGRIGWITITVDGRNWLSGATADNGTPPPAAVWRCLASNELQPAQGVTIAPEPSDPRRATLRGKIAIDVRYGGQAEVKELRLVRRTPAAGWTVDPEDVERIAKDIGLAVVPAVIPQPRPATTGAGRHTEPAAGGFPWLWAAGGGAAVLVAVLVWVAMSGRRRRARPAGPSAPG
jgi:hypothetical protein